MKIVVAGSGAFGTALAIALCTGGCDVTLLGREPALMDDMRSSRRNPRLAGCTLPRELALSSDPDVLARADTVLLCAPAQALGQYLETHRARLGTKPLVACCKGIDLATLTGPSGVIRQSSDGQPAILTGPSFAADIARGLPTALTLATEDDRLGEALQQALSTPVLRLYRSGDMLGAELGGALKNVIAIACGAAIGAGLGDSARAALMTRGFAEMTRIAARMGARPETLAGLSGLGDLALTCTSDLSRNYRFGLALGRGAAVAEGETVEGKFTAEAMARRARMLGEDTPVVDAVDALVQGRLTVPEVLDRLLARPLRAE